MFCLQDLLTLPPLPSNAEYIKTRACTTTWGAIGAVLGQLPSAKFEYFMVLDSSVKGPFIPTYAQQVWAESLQGTRVRAVCAGVLWMACGVAEGQTCCVE